ncbi:hypothetical protein LSI99_09010, partial [Klebsiella quasipneumoniae subsp. similipneumoniae]|nr:hypothetical protein [Klebsiella quasipneumoniae subsp. similipneumoniae]
ATGSFARNLIYSTKPMKAAEISRATYYRIKSELSVVKSE